MAAVAGIHGLMLHDTPTVSQLSHVIAQSIAPAFLLAALAGFIGVLVTRLNRIIDRTIALNTIPDDDAVKSRLKADLPRLLRRADRAWDRPEAGARSRHAGFLPAHKCEVDVAFTLTWEIGDDSPASGP